MARNSNQTQSQQLNLEDDLTPELAGLNSPSVSLLSSSSDSLRPGEECGEAKLPLWLQGRCSLNLYCTALYFNSDVRTCTVVLLYCPVLPTAMSGPILYCPVLQQQCQDLYWTALYFSAPSGPIIHCPNSLHIIAAPTCDPGSSWTFCFSFPLQ